MTERKKVEYSLNLAEFTTTVTREKQNRALVRADVSNDEKALADLMISAYVGTIDYDGETVQDALEEVRSYNSRSDLTPLPACSWMALKDGSLVSTCLVGWWEPRESPLIAYIMTAGDWKQQGLAALVLRQSLNSLKEVGYDEVFAFISKGNVPSEKLFLGFGFVPKG